MTKVIFDNEVFYISDRDTFIFEQYKGKRDDIYGKEVIQFRINNKEERNYICKDEDEAKMIMDIFKIQLFNAKIDDTQFNILFKYNGRWYH